MVAGSSSQCGIVPDQISKGTHNPRIRFGQYDRPDYLPHRLSMASLAAPAIQMELAGSNIAADIAEWGTPVSLFAYVKNLPLTPVLYGLVFLAIIISITTMINAMIFTLSDMSTKPRFLEEGNRRKGPLQCS